MTRTSSFPPRERARVFQYVHQTEADGDAEIPESFKQGMADAAAGRFADVETVLSGAKPPARRLALMQQAEAMTDKEFGVTPED